MTGASHKKGRDGVAAGVGGSAPFLEILEQARRFADILRPILLRGERGTGKELIARALHR